MCGGKGAEDRGAAGRRGLEATAYGRGEPESVLPAEGKAEPSEGLQWGGAGAEWAGERKGGAGRVEYERGGAQGGTFWSEPCSGFDSQ